MQIFLFFIALSFLFTAGSLEAKHSLSRKGVLFIGEESDFDLSQFAEIEKVKKLNVYQSTITGFQAFLKKAGNLEEIIATGSNLNDGDLSSLKSAKNRLKLQVINSRKTIKKIDCSKLKILNLVKSELKNLSNLENQKNLEVLSLTETRTLSLESLKDFKGLTHLELINIGWDGDFPKLDNLTKLGKILLDRIPLKNLKFIPNRGKSVVWHLTLKDTGAPNLASLGRAWKLQSFIIEQTGITARGYFNTLKKIVANGRPRKNLSILHYNKNEFNDVGKIRDFLNNPKL